jgi:tight adherence protein B
VSLGLGLLLGGGLLLTVSPLLWPRAHGARGRALPRWSGALRLTLAQAGLAAVPVGGLVLVSALAGVAASAVAFALVSVPVIALVAGAAGIALPWLVVSVRAASRRAAARVLWPDAVDQLVSAVRSGLALPDALVTLAHTGPTLTRDAFSGFAADYRATGNFGLAVDELKDRLADPVADRILETLRMSREVGGTELTTVLRNLSSALRQEAAIRSEVEARQSWTVNAARLGVAAPWIVLLLLASRPEAAAAYNSQAGVLLIVAGLVVSAVAYRLMIGLGKLPAERRWFG